MKKAIGMAPRRRKKIAKRKVARKKTASRRKTISSISLRITAIWRRPRKASCSRATS